MKLFKDQEAIDETFRKRDELIHSLGSLIESSDERRFIVKRINDITERLIEQLNYSKDKPQL